MRTTFILVIALTVLTSFKANTNIKISSPAFADDGMIPEKYTCEGANTSPELNVTDIPAGAKSLAIILHDPDAPIKGGFTHWVIWNLNVDGRIPENYQGGEQGMNGAQKKGYIGMCPPSGTHHYHFMVYALDTKLNLSRTAGKDALEKAMQGHVLAKGDLVGLYKKMK